MSTVLCCRLDNAGDVLLTGPAVRAVAAGPDRVAFLCGPNGEDAARMLPGVDEVVVHRAAWIDPGGTPVDREAVRDLVDRVEQIGAHSAIVFTSFHQSALPTALLLRLAGVGTIAAISDDYPGTLLDVRHRLPDDIHEVERNLSLAATLGFRLPPGDDGRLHIRPSREGAVPGLQPPYVVVHPGASAPARTWPVERFSGAVEQLVAEGWRVVVTGSPGEAELTATVAGRSPAVIDLGGRTSLAELAGIVAGATALVCGNTGPAHLASAVGTPVVELYAPTVPPSRWRPWGVPHLLLGDLDIACAGCRAVSCPVPGHPCLAVVSPGEVADAVRAVVAGRDHTLPAIVAGTVVA